MAPLNGGKHSPRSASGALGSKLGSGSPSVILRKARTAASISDWLIVSIDGEKDGVQAIIDGALIGTDVIAGLPENLQKVVNKLEAAFRLAMQTEQSGSAVQAAMSMAKLLGLVVEHDGNPAGLYRMRERQHGRIPPKRGQRWTSAGPCLT